MMTAKSKVSGKVYRARPARRYREYTVVSPNMFEGVPFQPTDPVFLVSDTINLPYSVSQELRLPLPRAFQSRRLYQHPFR
jgi:hypothetical protein